MKLRTSFVCQQCGVAQPKFLGRCPNCGEWNSLVETVEESPSARTSFSSGSQRKSLKPVYLNEVKASRFTRLETGIGELDQVLGGGLVPGQAILLAGEPGVGKSTLLLQIAASLGKKGVLYASGEESVEQISLRGSRLSTVSDNNKDIALVAENNTETIIATLQSLTAKPSLVIVDSIQTMWSERLTGTPGSVGQIRECARLFIEFAKKNQVPVVIVGHVTKEGTIAGPKILEHLVDTVFYLEGERFGSARLLRVVKNRFGPSDEVGVFKMAETGIEEVKNPSALFFDKKNKTLPGQAVVVVLEGVRPLAVEVQALVAYSELKNPRRVGNGINYNRLSMLVAILTKHLRLPLEKYDIYVNVSSGFKISEPAADLGIALAIYTSFKNKTLPKNAVAIGELSLLGEIRQVQNYDKRVKEAKKLGFEKILSYKDYPTLKAVTA